MPILGIMASQISGHLWAPEGAYDSLASVTPSGSVSSITFAGIPTGYKHLQLRIFYSITTGSIYEDLQVRFNSDSSASYTLHQLKGNGSAASAFAATGKTEIAPAVLNTTTTTTYSTCVLDILDYSNTNKYKTTRDIFGWDANGSGDVGLRSGLWLNTAAISTIGITFTGGYNFTSASSFALYGCK
jgi:hypothetical protein